MADSTSTRVEPDMGPTPGPSAAAGNEPRAAVEPAASGQVRIVPAPRSANDQLARIEDKTARIEEKYARSEAILQRVGSTVEAATSRMNEVASQAELAALRNEVSDLAARLRRLPGTGALFMMAIVTALLTAGLVYALLRYGIPGAGALPR